MSAGIWHRLEQAFERALHHHDRELGRNAIMSAFTHLKACVIAGNARIADLEVQLAAAKAQPAGAADSDLDALSSSIESALGTSVADPDASGNQGPDQGAQPGQPVVGPTSTTVTGADGSTTTLDHASGTASTTDASGTPAPTDQAAADAAKAAAVAQGVAVAGA